MTISVTTEGFDTVMQRISRMGVDAHNGLVQVMSQLGIEFVQTVKDKLSGQILNARTGKLRDSIFSEVNDRGSTVEVTIGSRGVVYAAIQEYGGTVQIPDIKPVNAKALHWVTGGADVFAMSARAHPVKIPERSYLRSTLKEYEPIIRERLQNQLALLMRRK